MELKCIESIILNNTQVVAMDQETGETAQTSVDIEVLQKGQSGKHTSMYTSMCACVFNSSKKQTDEIICKSPVQPKPG